VLKFDVFAITLDAVKEGDKSCNQVENNGRDIQVSALILQRYAL
jgi:hypothetical protein